MNIKLLRIKSLHARLKLAKSNMEAFCGVVLLIAFAFGALYQISMNNLVKDEREFWQARIIDWKSREDTLRQENKELKLRIDRFDDNLRIQVEQMNSVWLDYLKSKDRRMALSERRKWVEHLNQIDRAMKDRF